MILKPDKGNGAELTNKVDYRDAMNQLLSDKPKSKIIKNNSILTRFKRVHNYLSNN